VDSPALPQQSAPGTGGAGVEQRKQGRAAFAAQGLGDLEIASRRRVERQLVAFALDAQASNVGQRGLCADCA
jgi:hypothetical protein